MITNSNEVIRERNMIVNANEYGGKVFILLKWESVQNNRVITSYIA